MAGNGRRGAASRSTNRGGEEVVAALDDDGASDSSPSSEFELARLRLRQRWELASVLNFLSVFAPVIGNDFKMSGEEIEMALINADDSLAKLHITLLKGIPPVSKNLSASETWVTVLCKKLAPWWPWVAEGEIPLTAPKGEEILRYKELDPEARLVMLKALCEIRADQDDSVSFINDAVKQGTEASSFRKEQIGVDSNGISYWFEANSVVGYRLYRETKTKRRGKACVDLPGVHMQWETLATNLNEFRTVLADLSSSNIKADVAICRTIETDAIPVLEKLQKKKERVLKRKLREESLLNDVHSFRGGTTRSCRNRKPVSYTFDEYDRMVDEAIQQTKKGKAVVKEQRYEKHVEDEMQNDIISNGGVNKGGSPSGEVSDSTEDDAENDSVGEENYNHEDSDDNNDLGDETKNKGDSDCYDVSDSDTGNNVKLPSQVPRNHVTADGAGYGKRKRLVRVSSQTSPVMKNLLRQRPVRNSAIDHNVALDSDEEIESY